VLDKLADIIDKARSTGRRDAEDIIAFAVYALPVIGPGWQLRRSGA
jgi:hypothetical protein